jgi:hypothetical protein
MGTLELEPAVAFVIEPSRGRERVEPVAAVTHTSILAQPKLIPVRVLVAVGAGVFRDLEAQGPNGSFPEQRRGLDGLSQLAVAGETRDRLVCALQRKRIESMSLDVDRGGVKAVERVAA